MDRLKRTCIVAAFFVAMMSGEALAQSSCAAPADWVSHQAVSAPDPSIAPNSNCAFHVWAWQTLLWMTQQGTGGGPRFLSFPTVSETFAPEGASPVILVTSGPPKVLVVTPRSTKSSDPFDSIVQAGRRGVLIHRNGRAVYYSVNVDRIYYEFIRSKKYYDPAVLENAPADENFPIGALEFKYSWRIVADGEDSSKFFVWPAEIHLLVERDGAVVVDPTQTQNVTVALVGIHVVGIVKDHPEFIWATFEHVDNAPDLPAGMSVNSPNPVSAQDWTFYRANTPANQSNRPNATIVKLEDPAKQVVSPIRDVFRQFPWGSQQSDASNAADIISLNTSVRDRVLASEPVWKNYMLVGGTWLLPNSLQPGQSFFSKALASTRLANATMETFIQSLNCFGCHSTLGASQNGVTLAAKNINLSHVLTDAYFRAKRTTNATSIPVTAPQ